MKKTLDKANKLIFVRDYEEAERLIESILGTKQHQDNMQVHLRKIELAVRLEKIELLISQYESKVERDSEEPASQLGIILAKQHGEIISPSEAVIEFQSFIKKHGGHPGAYYGIGYSMEIQGQLERAAANYESCINLDSTWFPGYFGLSQVYYQLGDEKKGDYYFYLFEEQAPYTVYGNFETHRSLSEEFLVDEEFEHACTAIKSLGEWWIENKGFCPTEIQLYEKFSLSRIFNRQGNQNRSVSLRQQGEEIAEQVLAEEDSLEGVLYFIAKTLEEFSEFEMALLFYKKILSKEVSNPEMVQKIGGQFLSMGEFRLAKDLFSEAYIHNPDNSEVRFCLLVADLRLHEVNVEEYMMGKERLKKLMDESGERVELLSLLHSLLAKYGRDADVHGNLAEVYLRLGNEQRASDHFEEMYRLDEGSTVSSLKYAAFEMQHGDRVKAEGILERLENLSSLTSDQMIEIHWLKSTYFYRERDFNRSLKHLRKIQNLDPWNVSYLVQEIANISGLNSADEVLIKPDSVMLKLLKNDEEDLKWEEFDKNTLAAHNAHLYELVYVREKLKFLYSNGEESCLKSLVAAACKFNPENCVSDFLRLLNTNFDGPNIYWGLGMLFKELWQLETASMWLEQILLFPTSTKKQKAKAYLELADCLVWRDLQLPKAIEFIKLAMELGERSNQKSMIVLSHALLRSGNIREAKLYLEETDLDEDSEALYLKGLLEYRNGAKQKANEIWKPLLTVTSESLRFHNIKQEILRYYFEKADYRGAVQ